MGISPKSPLDFIGGPILNVAGGEANECSPLLMNLACADLVADLGIWVVGGGVMAPVARTGEPSLGRLLLRSLVPLGLDRGVVLPGRIADSSMGVRGVVISDMLRWPGAMKQNCCYTLSGHFPSCMKLQDQHCLHERT